MPSEEEVVARLRLICGETYVLSSPAELAAYATDRQKAPSVVVVPGTVNEVSASVKACNSAQVTYAPRGAGTTGAEHSAVVITLARLRRIIDVDRAAGSVTVETGAPLMSVRRALPEQPSVFSEVTDAGVATVGGALATGHGLQSLIELELVTADGSVVKLDREAAGYDLAGAFVGSQGRAGIAVRARLRVSRAIPAQDDPEGSGDG